jgi:XapX domain-containing protein
MTTRECVPLDPSVAVSHRFLQTELLLASIAAGLLLGLVYCLVKVRVPGPIVFALVGVVVMLLGQITVYVLPFGVGLILGLAYDAFEEEWYGSGLAESAGASNRLRLFLKNSISQRLSSLLGPDPSSPIGARRPRDLDLSAVAGQVEATTDKTSRILQEVSDLFS